jgi:hypothetical protein
VNGTKRYGPRAKGTALLGKGRGMLDWLEDAKEEKQKSSISGSKKGKSIRPLYGTNETMAIRWMNKQGQGQGEKNKVEIKEEPNK